MRKNNWFDVGTMEFSVHKSFTSFPISPCLLITGQKQASCTKSALNHFCVKYDLLCEIESNETLEGVYQGTLNMGLVEFLSVYIITLMTLTFHVLHCFLFLWVLGVV